jgi:hypothetical protein
MALDFQSYLISASPPDFDFPLPMNVLKRRRSPEINVTGLEYPKPANKPVAVSNELWRLQEQLLTEENLTPQEEFEGFGLTKCTNRANDADRIRSWQTSYNCNPVACACTKIPKRKSCRKVIFADEAGLNLSDIQSIEEASDDPPVLRFDLLSLGKNSVTEPEKLAISLIVNFPQPAADYLAFHNKVSAMNVSLENIIVRDNWNLVGTVKVKNIGFNKKVTIHWTSDCWTTSQDAVAHYVDFGRPTPFGQFDTFSFEITVPSSISPSIADPIQFAVCYTVDGCEYWDNNNQQNYKIAVETKPVCSDVVDATAPALVLPKWGDPSSAFMPVKNGYCNSHRESHFAVEPSVSLSEFAIDSSSPYW